MSDRPYFHHLCGTTHFDGQCPQEKRPSELPPAQCSATALREELNTIIELAEWGIANERLGGNVVKEEHWKGQRFAATQVLQWLDAQSLNAESSHAGAETHD